MKSIHDKITARMNKLPLGRGLVQSFLIIWFIPYMLICVILISFLFRSLMNKELEIVQSSLELTEDSCNKILTNIHNFSDRIYVNKQLQNVILREYDNIKDIYEDYAGLSFMDDYLRGLNEVSSFRIYVDNETLLDNSFIIKTTKKIRQEEWYNVAIRMNGQPFWIYKTDTITKKKHLALVRSIWHVGQYVGVLVINVDSDYIQESITSKLYETKIIYNNEILYSSKNSTIIDEDAKIIDLANNFYHSNKRLNKIKIEDNTYGAVAFKFYPKNTLNLQFLIIFFTPLKDLISVTWKVIIISMVLLGFLGGLTYFLIDNYTFYIDSRVNKLQSGINSVVSNNFDIVPSIGGNDEFEDIYKSLYLMSNNIKNLIDQVYRQNLEKEQLASRQNEIRYKMLATQINPHFLFNTLETIRMKSLASGDKDVASMLKLLASLLRYNLTISGKPVCFYDELNSIQNYLTIQHIRFGSRISYDIVPLCDISNIMILPLLIQPIVENSFSHGLEDTTENGFIYIFAEVQSNDGQEILTISMRDNGKGIPQDRLIELQEKLKMPNGEEESDSIGIFNVNARIKLFYGQQYGLTIESREGKGTVVTLRVPVIYTSNIIPKFQRN